MNIFRYAEEMLRLQDEASMAPPITSHDPSFSTKDAYAVSAAMMQGREAAGWQRVGRKIGFTNRTIWDQYGVYEPNFGYMYDRTLIWADDGAIDVDGWGPEDSLSLRGLVQPLIEPEIVFRLRAPLPLTDDQSALIGAVDWLGHGFEVVQCHFPNWKFQVADTIADNVLHGRYVVGWGIAVTAENRQALADQLASFKLTLYKGGDVAATGGGELVLGSPLNALAYLASSLESLPEHPSLEAGELITTGTLTTALPVAPGQTWFTRIHGLPLSGLTLRFEE
jgi:2-oxo-3-hexenedioate decarboxylase